MAHKINYSAFVTPSVCVVGFPLIWQIHFFLGRWTIIKIQFLLFNGVVLCCPVSSLDRRRMEKRWPALTVLDSINQKPIRLVGWGSGAGLVFFPKPKLKATKVDRAPIHPSSKHCPRETIAQQESPSQLQWMVEKVEKKTTRYERSRRDTDRSRPTARANWFTIYYVQTRFYFVIHLKEAVYHCRAAIIVRWLPKGGLLQIEYFRDYCDHHFSTE